MRRLGVDLASDLARALGTLPDPRRRFVFPDCFFERLNLSMRVDNAIELAWAGRRLIAMLCGWLAARGSGLRSCVFVFEHEHGRQRRPATEFAIGFSSITRDVERMTGVFVERLRRLDLPASVIAIALRAGVLEALPGHTSDLFGKGRGRTGNSVAVLVDSLQARLGSSRVHSLSAVAEHRPENASRSVAPNCPGGQRPFVEQPSTSDVPARLPFPRPLCLLAKPQILREVAGRPHRDGSLRLLVGPERIESGWWDAAEPEALGDVCRDYFVAISAHSEWLWIFRSQAGWFLHGIFV